MILDKDIDRVGYFIEHLNVSSSEELTHLYSYPKKLFLHLSIW